MKKITKYRFYIALAGAIIINYMYGIAQPASYMQQCIGETIIYSDFKDDKLYYYVPGELSLEYDESGKPVFQLLQMRYTGTKLADDSGEKRFTNIVQFSVKMKKMTADKLKVIRQQLGDDITLRPLPIKKILAHLIIPATNLTDSERDVVIQGNGNYQTEGQSDSSFWTERTFTIKLDNYASQLLWQQVENGELSINVNYSFGADMIERYAGDVWASGDSTFLQMTDDIKEQLQDDIQTTYTIVKSAAFTLEIDTRQYPELLKKIDINEELPPLYPLVEVKCFDFTDSLTPDIAIKKVQLRATNINGEIIELPIIRFSKGQPDIHTHQLKSRYAISLQKPLYYKITTISEEGEKHTSSWIKHTWGDLIDITIPEKERTTLQRTIEAEYNTEEMENEGVISANLYVEYTLNNTQQKQKLDLFPNESSNIIIRIRYDKNTQIKYRIVWKYIDNRKVVSRRRTIGGDYFYIKTPRY